MSRRASSPAEPPSLSGFLFGPQPIARVAWLRLVLPLVLLAFMSTRLIHADHWIGDAGFRVPDLGGDWRQPLYLPSLPAGLAWALAALMVVSGLATSLGVRGRAAALAFAATLLYVALSDRLAAFTVTKLAPVLVLVIAVSAGDRRLGLDALLGARRGEPRPTHSSGGPIRFIQIFLPTFYCASGIAKARGDWLERSDVLFTHLHDSYQTWLSHLFASHLPGWSWAAMQHTTLVFEVFAPVFFAWRTSRPFALAYGVMMHALIGLMFGPVIWFSCLMITLLLVGYLPAPWLERSMVWLESLVERAWPQRHSGANSSGGQPRS